MDSEVAKLSLFTKKIKRELKTGLFFSFFINILMLVSPIFMLQAYDRVLPSRSELTLLMLLLLAIALLVIMGVLDSLRHRLMAKSGSILDQVLAPPVFRSIVELNRTGPAANGAQYLNELSHLKQFVAGTPICVFFDAPWVPLFIACNYLIHPLLGTITLFGALTIFFIAFVNERVSRKPTEDAQQFATRAQQYADQGLAQIDTVQAMGMTKALENKWLGLRAKSNDYSDKSNIQAGLFTASTKAYRLSLQTGILAAGCWLAIEQAITPGAMIAASIIMGRALAPVEQAIGTWRVFVKARTAYKRLDQLLIGFPQSTQRITHTRPRGEVLADKLIILAPNSKKPILKGLSFKLPAGASLMIGGSSGTGKSTLLRALAGIWRPHSGNIKIDGIDISQWNNEDLGQYIGFMSQSVDFLPGTVRDNIARFQNCTDQDVLNAAQFAGVHELITSLQQGYDTILDTNGSILSSGQKQLVGLARAVFKKPSLVILDEPNAHLDRQGNKLFEHILYKLKKSGTTTIVVSHKESVIAHVDYYMEIKMGQTALFASSSELTKPIQGAPESTS